MHNFLRTAKVAVSILGVLLAVTVAVAGIAIAKPFIQELPGLQEAAVHTKASLSTTDSDRDGLTNFVEVRRTRTNPHKADTDGDGLSDGTEVQRTKTNPRKADSDGDGASDGAEIAAGTDPWNPASYPGSGRPPENPNPPPPPPVDTTSPNTTITSGPAATTTATSAKFSFSSSETGSTFACKLDSGAFGSCTSPKSYSGLSVGSHTFSVRATDAAGNADQSPAVRAWTVQAPSGPPADAGVEAVWVAPPTAQANVPVVLDGTASDGPAPLDCTWSFENADGSAVYQTQNGCKIDFTFESPGTKYVKLTVENDEGETDTNKQSLNVVSTAPDTAPPNTTIDSGPSGSTTASGASFAFSSSEANSSFQCQLDGAALAACTSPKSYSGLGVGSHTFSVQASDAAGNVDLTPATQTWTVETGPPPPPDTTPPNTTIASGPSSSTTATSASFSFTSTETGSTFACKIDSGAFGSCTSPKSYSGLSVGNHTFSVQASDAAGNVDLTPASQTWTVQAETEPPPTSPGCVAGATNATTASAVRSAVVAGKSVCVTANVGDVTLESLGNRAGVVVSTEGTNAMGHVLVKETSNLTIRNARLRSIEIRSADGMTLENSVLGGTKANRVEDQLIFAPDESNNVVIRNNDLGWTIADDSGNTGYGCRCYGELNHLRFVGNHLHDLASDGFQGSDGEDVLIDRNNIGPVGANPSSSEHSDLIQIVSNGPGFKITNNWLHEQGYYEGAVTHNAGSTYIHGQVGAGTTGSLLYENNLIEKNQGRTEICGLGTGGTTRNNITIRRNTWVEGGLAFTSFPGFEWDCDSGSGNLVERNIAVDPSGGFAQDGSAGAATFLSNLWGQRSLVTLDASGNCTSANCNPSGQEAIGYRKPSGVNW
jgi:hypothetical protein